MFSLVAEGRRHCPCRAPPTSYEVHAQITTSKPASLDSPPFPSDCPSFRIEFTSVVHETPLHQANGLHPYQPCGVCFPLSGPSRQPCTYSIISCTLQQCGTLGFLVPVVTPPSTPPYFLIVYDDRDMKPTVYPLTVEKLLTSWTVVYPAGQSYLFLCTFVHRGPC